MKQDKELICADCSESFIWTTGEQNFMEQLYSEGKVKKVTTPKRCSKCRATRKKNNDEHTH